MVTGRFAPSPTGPLHLGNLRTALAAHMSARSRGGQFLVRFEDLDPANSSRSVAARQLEDLGRVGISWDTPPVFQSDRFALYEETLSGLAARGVTYDCFCTRREIREAAAAPHGHVLRYPGTCRTLSRRRRAELAEQRRPAVRLLAQAAPVTFVDRRLGPVSDVPDDIVLRRNDGVPAYNLAVVVDDHLQGVTEVVRGDDLALVTCSHSHLREILGWAQPDHAHVPLMMGADGQRLSKSNGAKSLDDHATSGDDVESLVASLVDEVASWGLW